MLKATSKNVKDSGDVVILDDLTKNFYQGIEAVIQISWMSSHRIPLKTEAYIENYAYKIQEEVLGEVIEGTRRDLEKIASMNSEGSSSYTKFLEITCRGITGRPIF